MKIREMLESNNENTLLLVTPFMLQEFGKCIVDEALKSRTAEETLYTPKEFAERHRVDVSTLWRWCKAGILKKTMVGTKVFYRDSDLREG